MNFYGKAGRFAALAPGESPGFCEAAEKPGVKILKCSVDEGRLEV